MMTLCLHGVHAMESPMTSCHIIPTWWEWNGNPNDVMPMWFKSHANPNDVMLGMHGTCVHVWQMFLSNLGML